MELLNHRDQEFVARCVTHPSPAPESIGTIVTLGLEQDGAAYKRLADVVILVAPILKAHGWYVDVFAELSPDESWVSFQSLCDQAGQVCMGVNLKNADKRVIGMMIRHGGLTYNDDYHDQVPCRALC